jgi:hypothetical protein
MEWLPPVSWMGWSSANPVLFRLAEFVAVEVLGTRKLFKGLFGPPSNSDTVPVGQGSGAPKTGTLVPNGGGTHNVPDLLVTAISKMYDDPYDSEVAAVLRGKGLPFESNWTRFTVTSLCSLPTLFTVPVVLAVLAANVPSAASAAGPPP